MNHTINGLHERCIRFVVIQLLYLHSIVSVYNQNIKRIGSQMFNKWKLQNKRGSFSNYEVRKTLYLVAIPSVNTVFRVTGATRFFSARSGIQMKSSFVEICGIY